MKRVLALFTLLILTACAALTTPQISSVELMFLDPEANRFHDMALSPDGYQLAVASGHTVAIFRVIDLLDGDLEPIRSMTYRVGSLAWSPDGQQIALSNYDGEIVIWEPATMQAGEPFSVVPDFVSSIRGVIEINWVVPGKLLPVPLEGGPMVYDSYSGDMIGPLEDTSGTLSAHWSAENGLIASDAFDGTLRIWSGDTYKIVQSFEYDPSVGALAWSPDGQQLIFAYQGEIYSWSPESGDDPPTPLYQIDFSPLYAAWSPNSRWIAFIFFEDGFIIWDVDREEIVFQDREQDIEDFEWLPDSSGFITASREEGRVTFWEFSR